MDSLLKPSNIHHKRRPSDILADTLRAQAFTVISEVRKKTSVGEEKVNPKSRKAVRFPLDVDLQEAIREGDIQTLKKMLQTYGKAVLKVRDPVGHPLPVIAVREKQLKVLKLLVNEGSDLTTTDKNGYTALHAAAEDDSLEMVRIIVAQKNSSTNLANLKTNTGLRPIDVCISVEMADLLMHADLEYFLGELEDIWTHHPENDELKVDGKGINDLPFKEDHLLHIVAGASKEKAQKYIDDFNGINGCSLLHLAAWKNYSRLGFYIAEEGLISLEAVDKNGWTPLHTAVSHSSLDMTLLLIELGANIFAENNEGQTPIFLAEDELIICILADAADATSEGSSCCSESDTLSE
jgi:ankyrin repeat protein